MRFDRILKDSLFKNSELLNALQHKLEEMISKKLPDFETKNEAKRLVYMVCMKFNCEIDSENHKFYWNISLEYSQFFYRGLLKHR